MAGAQPVQNPAAGSGNPVPSPAQVLMDLTDKMTAMLTATVIPTNKDEHDAEVARVREEIARAKEALPAEYTRLATERADLDARAQRLQSEAF